MHAEDFRGDPVEYDPKARPGPDALLFAGGEYAPAMVGATADGRAVYDLEAMIVWLMRADDCGYEDALDHIEYNVIGSLPNAGPRGPVIIQR